MRNDDKQSKNMNLDETKKEIQRLAAMDNQQTVEIDSLTNDHARVTKERMDAK